MFDTVLVANRGEIAVRVLATLVDLGIRGVAVYSDADAGSLHVRRAEVALRLGPAAPAESYLHVERIIGACQRSGAQAVHPGYGFLSENAAFARACADAGIVFVGPPPAAIEAMGDKIRAKHLVEAAGVPVVPGVHRAGMEDAQLVAAADEVGYPLVVKAAAGGGGRGMRVVGEPTALAEALAAARREALGGFGDDTLMLERYLQRPRHVEVQILADGHGRTLHLGERECSLQRRHQKVIEECPSPLADEALRQRLGAAAVAAARACGYVGAGTVEFIISPEGEYFFLEMNTRLQVEHPVTEEVYGVDLVEWQLRVAAGEPLTQDLEALRPKGHAVEARIYAEDPGRGFLPTGGTILASHHPVGEGIRVDAGTRVGMEIGGAYDPLLDKIVAWGPDRTAALRRLGAALGRYQCLGVATNVDFLRALLACEEVRAGNLDTGLIERSLPALVSDSVPDQVLAAAALARLSGAEPEGRICDPFDVPGGWRVGEHAETAWRLRAGGRSVTVMTRGRACDSHVRVDDGAALPALARLDGDRLEVVIDGVRRTFLYAEAGRTAWLGDDGGGTWLVEQVDDSDAVGETEAAAAAGPLRSPLPGTVSAVNVALGQKVAAGQTLLVVEAMKMEHPIVAGVAGVVTALHVTAGQQVAIDAPLALVEPAGEAG